MPMFFVIFMVPIFSIPAWVCNPNCDEIKIRGYENSSLASHESHFPTYCRGRRRVGSGFTIRPAAIPFLMEFSAGRRLGAGVKSHLLDKPDSD